MPSDAWKVAQQIGRITPSSIAVRGDVDPNAIENTCKGCGRYMELNGRNVCGTSECHEGRLQRAVDKGDAFHIGNTYIFDGDSVNTYREPLGISIRNQMQIDHNEGGARFAGELPVCVKCPTIPRPDDTLCIRHRLEENASLKRKPIQHVQTNVGDADELPSRRNKRYRPKMLSNKIKGFGGLK